MVCVPERQFKLRADIDSIGLRLDQYLASKLKNHSRSAILKQIRRGCVYVGNKARKANYRIHAGDLVWGPIPVVQPIRFEPEPIDLDIVYEDAAIMVINKPAGMVVHPAPGHYSGTLVNGLLFHCQSIGQLETADDLRPGIVHRLDKDTSGLLIVAKTDLAHRILSQHFKERLIKKVYLALVHGVPQASSGLIDDPIGRHPADRKRMSIHSRRARTALTKWHVDRRFDSSALLRLNLKTGRTHQIRVHLASIGHPVVGDVVYGKCHTARRNAIYDPENGESIRRQMLHAWRLGLRHPVSGDWLQFEIAPPDDMAAVLRCLKTKQI